MFQPADLNSVKDKLNMTQKLLSKIEKELELYKNNKQIDSSRLLEIINKSFHTYELCAQEFCFELELLQLSFIGSFFKQYMQGYHKIINIILKYSTEKLQTNSVIQRVLTKQTVSDYSDESSPINKKEKTRDLINFTKKTNLYEKYDRIDQMTKVQMELNDPASTKDLGFNMLPLMGKPAGVDGSMHKDRKSYTIQLLRMEMLNQQTQNQAISKKYENVMKKLNESELAKKNLEDEILNLVKLQKNLQNNTTKMILNNNNNNNRIGGGFDMKNSGKKSQANIINADSGIFNENTDINEYLKKVETKKQEIEKKTKEEIEYLNEMKKSHIKDEKKDEIDEEEKQSLDEMNELLSKREKTFSNIKDSGAAKELKQYLRKMATRKNEFSKLNNELINEFDEINDIESPMITDYETKKVMVKKPKDLINRVARSSVISPEIPPSLKKKTVEKATGPDPLIFDIQIIEALKFTIEKLKAQLEHLEEDNEFYQKEAKRLTDDLRNTGKAKQVADKSKDDRKNSLDATNKSKLENELNTMKGELEEAKHFKKELESKLKSKKAKIKFLKNELSSSSSNNKQQDSSMMKLTQDQNDLKSNAEKLKIENKALKAKIELLNMEIEKLKKELGLRNEEFLNMKEDYEQTDTLYHKTKEGNSTASSQISLLTEKAKMLEGIVSGFEEGKKKLELLQESDSYKKNIAEMKQNLEGIEKNKKNINEIEVQKTTPRKPKEEVSKNVKNAEPANTKMKEKEIKIKENEKKEKTPMKTTTSNKSISSPPETSKPKSEENKIQKHPMPKPTKMSNFKPVLEETKGDIEKKEKEKESVISYNSNFEKNTNNNNKMTGDQEKTIKNLQNRLQSEIIQKEHIIMEKKLLEEEIVILKKEVIEIKEKELQNKGNSTIKTKINLPPIQNNEEKANITIENQITEKKSKPVQIKNNEKAIKNEILNVNNNANNIVIRNENPKNSISLTNRIQAKIQKKEDNSANLYQMTNPTEDTTENSNLTPTNIPPPTEKIILDKFINKSLNKPIEIIQKNPKLDQKFVNLSQKYHIDKQNNYSLNYTDNNNSKYDINNKISSQQSLHKIERQSSEIAFNSYVSFENITNPLSITNPDSSENNQKTEASNNKTAFRREEEKKKEDEKINVMFENMRDIVTLEGENLLKNENVEVVKIFQKIINKANDKKIENIENGNDIDGNLELGLEEFKEAMNEIKNEHRRCGPNCIHLRRFYEKLGFSEKKFGKKLYYLHKRIINKLPKLA